MFAKIAAAIAAALKSMGTSAVSILDWCEQVVRWPFSLVFGHGAPTPTYTPAVSPSDVIEEFQHARNTAAAIHTLDRDGIDSVLEFCRAHKNDRVGMALPKNLEPPVRAALMSMSDAELRAVATSGIGAVRRFLDGKMHGIPGVREFGSPAPKPANDAPPRGMTRDEEMLWKARAFLMKSTHSQDFKIPRL